MPITPTNVNASIFAEIKSTDEIKNKTSQAFKSLIVSMKPVNELEKEEEEETEHQLLDLNYPESDIKRFPVVIKYKSWFIKWKEYEPVKYTAQSVLLNPAADLDLVS
jgi:hypothetical protein